MSQLEPFFFIILMFAVFYFIVFRPQQKRMKEHKARLAAMRRGDTVVTAGGVIGKDERGHGLGGGPGWAAMREAMAPLCWPAEKRFSRAPLESMRWFSRISKSA